MTPEQFAGRRVATLRNERGWTQQELAERLAQLGHEMHQTTVAKLESGRRPIRLNELIALATLLEVPATSLMPQDGAPSAYEVARLEANDLARQVDSWEKQRDHFQMGLDHAIQRLEEANRAFEQALDRMREAKLLELSEKLDG